MNKVNVFLDLEETVLNNWAEGYLINSAKVRDFLQSHNADGFHVFSFAVWNDDDKAEFRKRHQNALERVLECPVLSCNSCDDFMKADTKFTGLRFDSLTDFINVRGKVGAFMNWTASNHAGTTNFLVDDVVPNAVWENQDTRTKCVFVNVNSLL